MWGKSGCRRSPVTTEALRARIWTRTSEPHIVFYEDSENRSPGADFGGFEVPNHDFSKNAVPHISRIFPALFPHFSRNSRPHFSRIFPAIFPQFPPAFFPHFSRIWKSPIGAPVALSHRRHNPWSPPPLRVFCFPFGMLHGVAPQRANGSCGAITRRAVFGGASPRCKNASRRSHLNAKWACAVPSAKPHLSKRVSITRLN